MPTLKNNNYELVAQALASGKSQRWAYEQAGYTYRSANAHRLCSSPAIIRRVDEILAERFDGERKSRELAIKKASLDESWIVERLKYAIELGLRGAPVLNSDGYPTGYFDGKRNLKAAIDGLRLCADLKGMRIRRHEIGPADSFPHMSDAELIAALAQNARALGLSELAVEEIAALAANHQAPAV